MNKKNNIESSVYQEKNYLKYWFYFFYTFLFTFYLELSYENS